MFNRRNWRSKRWLGGGKKILDILFSCNTRTGFSDRNSGPKLCAVSIVNDGKLISKRILIFGKKMII